MNEYTDSGNIQLPPLLKVTDSYLSFLYHFDDHQFWNLDFHHQVAYPSRPMTENDRTFRRVQGDQICVHI